MENSRRTAAFAYARWLATGDFADRLLDGAASRPFVQEMLFTAIKRRRAIEKALGPFLRRRPKGEMEALLAIGAAQILYMDTVPDFAAVNETVEAAKSCGKKSVAKTVNAVLRNLLRSREAVEKSLAGAPAAVRESFPDGLYSRWEDRYGAEGALALARWHNEAPETHLARRGGVFEPLAHGTRVEDAPGYAEGEFIVQDPATALAVGLLAPAPGERILDACAAPGGKTVQIAWRGADVAACEVNPRRRRRLEENLARARPGAVEVFATLDGFAEGSFDKVLADAPCTNTGVLKRRADARWNWSAEKLSALAGLQAEILDRCAALVRPGGLLVYSTCSLEPEENSMQAEAFLSRHPEFSPVNSRESFPPETRQDGAFAASFRRIPGRSAGAGKIRPSVV